MGLYTTTTRRAISIDEHMLLWGWMRRARRSAAAHMALNWPCIRQCLLLRGSVIQDAEVLARIAVGALVCPHRPPWNVVWLADRFDLLATAAVLGRLCLERALAGNQIGVGFRRSDPRGRPKELRLCCFVSRSGLLASERHGLAGQVLVGICLHFVLALL